MFIEQVFEHLKTVHARSKAKHGPWKGTPDKEQFTAVLSEVVEYVEAYSCKDVDGPHGEIAELFDIMNVAMRRILVLTGEPDA